MFESRLFHKRQSFLFVTRHGRFLIRPLVIRVLVYWLLPLVKLIFARVEFVRNQVRLNGLVSLLLLLVGLTGCALPSTVSPIPTTIALATIPLPPTPEPEVMALPTLMPTGIPIAVPVITPTTSLVRINAVAGVPAELLAAATTLVSHHTNSFSWVAAHDPADLQLTLAAANQPPTYPLATWVYAVAAPFNTFADNLTTTELAQMWQTGSLVLTEDAAALLTFLFGPPSIPITPVAPENLVNTIWANGQMTVLPFHHLTPELKVLRLDGYAPIDMAFDAAAYPLRLTFGLEGVSLSANNFLALWTEPETNWYADQMTHIAMTGVTGTGRAVGYQMEISGITFPGEEIAPLMNAVDIAHMSHEIPFASDCPFPDPTGGTTFCASDRYLELLTSLGIDIVEMTGNHINDWGEPNVQHTFDLYESVGMRWFGGGRDLTQAQQPLTLEHNGNHLAFVGCNPVGPAYAWADVRYGGANPCPDYTTTLNQIRQLQAEGYVVIATVQYWEDYAYLPTGQQRVDFRMFAEAGAAAVSGSQGHHAMGFGFHQGVFIHYGLGNLIFDQPQMVGTEQTFIDVYTIYNGRLLNVDLWTGMIEYLSRPRAMSPTERQQLLESTFQASDWNNE